ncbi:Secondary metabolism regulator LAE1 [Madurella fahalii]|uniref:Secondary metabolism regulator LAE1 n=1 Tax=Madurella fahalii TaxID=1157608 RepID=A0ABQ0GLD6_9PEZI
MADSTTPAPVTRSPKAQSPETKSPKNQSPKAQSPKAQSPKAQSPAADTAEAGRDGDNSLLEAGILPASHWEPIQQEWSDGDSAYSEAISSTASLSSSILEYRTLHGRTYHSEIGNANAWAPNDAQHTESMDLYHHVCTLVLGEKLYLAPITKDIKKAIDIGTGTGIWAIDFADEFPSTEVTGTDVSVIQPSWVPPNLKFVIDDANLDWTWNDNTFDFIHVRLFYGAIADWPKFYREAFRVCTPGGWLEHHEATVEWRSEGGVIPEDSPMGQWSKVYWEGGKKFGRTFRVIEDDIQKTGMEEAGFVDIVVKDFKCPIGDWPKDPKQKELGMFAKLTLEADIEGYILYMWNAVMGWSTEEIRVYIAHLRRQMRDPNVRPWYQHRVVYGRKPEKSP